MRAVYLNSEQGEMLERLKEAEAQFGATPRLRASTEAIDDARALIGDAAALKMPPASYVGLQIYVSNFDNEMQLPEHLRDLSRSSGE